MTAGGKISFQHPVYFFGGGEDVHAQMCMWKDLVEPPDPLLVADKLVSWEQNGNTMSPFRRGLWSGLAVSLGQRIWGWWWSQGLHRG